jgi:hypothetical protein
MEQINMTRRTIGMASSPWSAFVSLVAGCSCGIASVVAAMLQWDSVVFLCGGFVAGIFFSTATRMQRPVDWLLFAGAVLFATAAFVHLIRSRRRPSGD